MNIVELFGGIGAIRKAYINSKIPFEIVPELIHSELNLYPRIK